MLKRTIYIGSGSYLRSKNRQLIIENKESGEHSSVPFDDIGVLELDNPQILLNNSLLKNLGQENIVILSCDEFHNPASITYPIVGNTLQTKKFISQVNSKKTLRNSLWQSIIKAKINNQDALLRQKNINVLNERSKRVLSGDPKNIEAQAASAYWKNIFDIEGFTRARTGIYPNNMLNYTYSIIRSLCTRSLVGAGLHPSLGIFHKNQYNPFCLADDLMESFRPFADKLVDSIYKKYDPKEDLHREIKRELLEVSYLDTQIEGQTRPLMIAIQRSSESLAKSFEKQKNLILTPCL